MHENIIYSHTDGLQHPEGTALNFYIPTVQGMVSGVIEVTRKDIGVFPPQNHQRHDTTFMSPHLGNISAGINEE